MRLIRVRSVGVGAVCGLICVLSGSIGVVAVAADAPSVSVQAVPYPGARFVNFGRVGDGDVVIGSISMVDDSQLAYAWSPAGGFRILDALAGDLYARADAIGSDGSVYGTSFAPPVSDGVSSEERLVRWPAGATVAQDLGRPSTSSPYSVSAVSVNASGQVLVYAEQIVSAGSQAHGYLWSPGLGYRDLGDFGSAVQPTDLNDDGVVVGQALASGADWAAFVWTPATGMTSIGTLPGDTTSSVTGIDSGGRVLGTSSRSGPSGTSVQTAFTWTAGAGIAPVAASGSVAVAMHRDGSFLVDEPVMVPLVPGGPPLVQSIRAIVHRVDGSTVQLPDLPGGSPRQPLPGIAFNAHEQVLVGDVNQADNAWSWSASGGYVALPRSSASEERQSAYDVTDDGLIVGQEYDAGFTGNHLIVWRVATAPHSVPVATPAANAAGWNKTAVSVAWNWAADVGGSGIDPANCPPTSGSSGEGTIVLSSSCKDLAGNTANATYTVKVDSSPPAINAAVTPANGDAFTLHQVVNANYSCSDSVSGVQQCAGTVASGSPIDTATAGTKAFVINSTDNAGNNASRTVSYTVLAGDASATLTGGGTVTSDPGNLGATPEVPIQTTITAPNTVNGVVSIAAQATVTGNPAGFALFSKEVVLTGPAATGVAPYQVSFTVDASTLGGIAPSDVQVFRNAVLVTGCTSGSQATPDPCIVSRGFAPGGGGDALVVVRTSQFSRWSLGRSLDVTPPTIIFGGAATYTVDQTVVITCTASDAGSGLASTSCPNVINAPAYTLPLGANTATATAKDKAGNTRTASFIFTVQVTPTSLCTLTKQFVQSGAKYQALKANQRAAIDANLTAICQGLNSITSRLTAPQKTLLITAYKNAAQSLVTAGWINQTQSTKLASLAGAM